VVRIENKSAPHIGMMFENLWLSRYPKPERCLHDNGGNFIGADFIRILTQCGVKYVPTMTKNSQANLICEQMHQSAGNVILHTITHAQPAHDILQANIKSLIML
jgi:hypothetical protein